MNTAGNRVGHDAVVTEELIGVVIRASQLGYSPWRVGIALRVAPMELAWICAHLNEHKPRRQILDRNVSRREFVVASERVDQEVVEHDRQL